MILTSLPQRNQQKLIDEGATLYFEKSMLQTDKGTGPFLEAVAGLLARQSPGNRVAADTPSGPNQ